MLATQVVVGTSKRSDGKERNQNESQELHIVHKKEGERGKEGKEKTK